MTKYKYLLKFIIIGDTGVGKSCLVLQFLENRTKMQHEITIGVEFGSRFVLVNNDTIKLQIWDTAGQENFRSITRSYYRSAIGAILVYDITKKESFENIENWLDDLKGSCNSQIIIMLVGNKCDLFKNRQVSFEQGEKLAQKHNLLFTEASAFSGEGVEKVFMNPVRQVYNVLEENQMDLTSNLGVKLGAQYEQNGKTPEPQNNKALSNQKVKRKERSCC